MAKRVVVVANASTSLVGVRYPLLKALRAAGHEVFCLAPGLEPGSPTTSVLQQHGIGCASIAMDRTSLNPAADLKALRQIVGRCRKLRPDVMLAYTMKPVVYGICAAWLTRVPHRVAMLTGLGYAFSGKNAGKRGLVQKIVRSLLRLSLARATGVIFHNKDDQHLLVQSGILKHGLPATVVDGSGIDLETFAPAPIPTGILTFVMVARLLVAKGVREFVDAAALLKEEVDARFVLVGPLDENPDSVGATEVDGWCEKGWVEWQGDTADVRPFLEASHVFVLPSYREGTPRSTLEAMATGRAVVTTDAPGCRETVRDGVNGYLVPVGDSDALAAAMRHFSSDPSLIGAMGEKSLDIARERYDVRKVNRDMMAALHLRGAEV